MDIEQVITEHKIWVSRNFPNATPEDAYLGMIEELGELAHAILKGKQGIRHTPDEILAMKKNACANIAIYVLHYFELQELSLDNFIKYVQLNERALNTYLYFCETEIIKSINMSIANIGYVSIIYALIAYLKRFCDTDLETEICNAWLIVRERDWTNEAIKQKENDNG